MGHLYNEYNSNGVLIDSYDDKFDRNLAIKICNIIFNDEFSSNGKYATDLRSIKTPNLYIEIEHGSWRGNHYTSNQRDVFNCGFESINVPERKFFNWNYPFRHIDILIPRQHMKYIPGKIVHFGRFNKEYNQFIIVRHEILMDNSKWEMKYDQKTNKSKILEDFICVDIKHCEIYNKQIDGTWSLNGKFCGPELEKMRIKELMNNK